MADEHATAGDAAADDVTTSHLAEGLRERKKRLTRQLLSDTATAMFLERGFDGFKVTDVAEACGVSEKTVYNYFPTKESLILDREEYVAESLRLALGPDSEHRSPVEAIVAVLEQERTQMRSGLVEIGGDEAGLALFRRFMAMLDETPSLRAASGEMLDRLTRVTAEALAQRAGVSPDDPEPTVAAHALVGLWEVQRRALRRDAPGDRDVGDVYRRAAEEVRRAGRLIDTGLWSFSVMVTDGGTREQLRTAAETAQSAARQVASALRQARRLWAQHAQSSDDLEQGVGEADWQKYSDEWKRCADEWDATGQPWRELQRETVQRWREAQRAHQQQWREAKQRMKQELRDELREAHRTRQGQARDARRRSRD